MERDFYRIECEETGVGPYQSGEYACIETPSSDRHPTPWNEGLWDRDRALDDDYHQDQQNFVCGFESIEQLLRWFDVKSLSNIERLGLKYSRHYNVIRFRSRVEHMRVAKCQAVARKVFLIEVSRLTLSDFINSVRIPEEAKALTYAGERVRLNS